MLPFIVCVCVCMCLTKLNVSLLVRVHAWSLVALKWILIGFYTHNLQFCSFLKTERICMFSQFYAGIVSWTLHNAYLKQVLICSQCVFIGHIHTIFFTSYQNDRTRTHIRSLLIWWNAQIDRQKNTERKHTYQTTTTTRTTIIPTARRKSESILNM